MLSDFFVVLLTFLAFAPVIWPSVVTDWRAAYAIACAVAGAGYLVARHFERRRDEKTWAEVLGNLADLPKLTAAAVMAQSMLHLAVSTSPTPNSLKQRALTLSDEVLRFLLDRRAHEPPMPERATWHRDTKAMIGYVGETMARYSLRFASRVIATRNELVAAGLSDPELDSFYEHPTNPIGVRIVAERIGALAQGLP
jgi:hypothetical protein